MPRSPGVGGVSSDVRQRTAKEDHVYGTIAKFVAKPGQDDTLAQAGKRWESERGHSVPGYLGQFVLTPDNQPEVSYLLVIFDSPESYRANAADPAQDAFYQEIRQLLAGDPEWIDGTITSTSTAGLPV